MAFTDRMAMMGHSEARMTALLPHRSPLSSSRLHAVAPGALFPVSRQINEVARTLDLPSRRSTFLT